MVAVLIQSLNQSLVGPQVKNAFVTFGAYDIIVEMEADTQENFDKAISLKIRSMPRVVSTMTLNIVNQ